jgi:hypothetical protein
MQVRRPDAAAPLQYLMSTNLLSSKPTSYDYGVLSSHTGSTAALAVPTRAERNS